MAPSKPSNPTKMAEIEGRVRAGEMGSKLQELYKDFCGLNVTDKRELLKDHLRIGGGGEVSYSRMNMPHLNELFQCVLENKALPKNPKACGKLKPPVQYPQVWENSRIPFIAVPPQPPQQQQPGLSARSSQSMSVLQHGTATRAATRSLAFRPAALADDEDDDDDEEIQASAALSTVARSSTVMAAAFPSSATRATIESREKDEQFQAKATLFINSSAVAATAPFGDSLTTTLSSTRTSGPVALNRAPAPRVTTDGSALFSASARKRNVQQDVLTEAPDGRRVQFARDHSFMGVSDMGEHLVSFGGLSDNPPNGVNGPERNGQGVEMMPVPTKEQARALMKLLPRLPDMVAALANPKSNLSDDDIDFVYTGDVIDPLLGVCLAVARDNWSEMSFADKEKAWKALEDTKKAATEDRMMPKKEKSLSSKK